MKRERVQQKAARIIIVQFSSKRELAPGGVTVALCEIGTAKKRPQRRQAVAAILAFKPADAVPEYARLGAKLESARRAAPGLVALESST